MIRGGVEYSLGIFITGVDKDSVADRAGLMIGDQILEVNGQSFLDVTHDEAVSQLKFHKRMSLLVRDVGKVPHSCTAYSDPCWQRGGREGGGVGNRSAYCWSRVAGRADGVAVGRRSVARKPRSAALQMVEEKARVVLSKAEFSTLAYYQEEYAARQMTIEAFVAVLLELLNTPEKYTLLTELREVVAPEDRSRFDELVYRREAEGQRCRELRDLLATPSRHHQQHRKAGVSADGAGNHALLLSNLHDLPGPGEEAPVCAGGWEAGAGVGGCVGVFSQQRPCQFPVAVAAPLSEPDEFRTPSEDSGVCLGADGPGCSRGAAAAGGGGGCGGGAWASSRRAASSDLALSATDDTDQVPATDTAPTPRSTAPDFSCWPST
ncbi:whirlin-like [Schistocerca gregaria]|uniref:whirlin-like n=1 Tax=Schistocerca gregaria TaxID=7010 RepID=UPI00211DD4DA|nr:whirlin-like [Schistocerca gregaria]